MNSLKNSKTINLLINVGFGFLIYYFRETFLYGFIIIFLYIIYLLNNNFLDKFLTSIFNLFNFKSYLRHTNIYVEFIFLFIFLFITQLSLVNYEIIDWDIATYMVVGNDIGNGNLPYVTQWDDKGPVLYYFYFILNFLSGENFLLFKIFSDIVLFLITLNLYLITKKLFPNNGSPISGSIIFLLFMSLPWATSEYSELFSLFFLSISVNAIINFIRSNKFQYLFFSGILFGMSTLINQGSGIFIFAFVFLIFLQNNFYQNMIKFVSGIGIPHILFFLIYYLNGFIEIYITTLFKIPFLYTSSGSNNSIYELVVFVRELYFSNINLLLILILLVLFKISEYFDFFKKRIGEINKNSLIVNCFLLSAFLFYFLSSTGYKHHLFYVFFFISIVSINLKKDLQKKLLIASLVVSFGISIGSHLNSSISNLNTVSVYENYPLRNVADIINNNFIEDRNFSIFALDHQLISYYLDKPNTSKIIHPTNYKEESIYSELVRIGYISDNEIRNQILLKPDVIICSGETKYLFDPYPCNIEDLFSEYTKIELNKYFESPNRSYYKDPYRTFEIYLKQS